MNTEISENSYIYLCINTYYIMKRVKKYTIKHHSTDKFSFVIYLFRSLEIKDVCACAM